MNKAHFFTDHLLRIISDKVLVFILLLFTILYLPPAFILADDLGLIIAYECDTGSHIAAIEQLLTSYNNMHAGYHSKFYGWTYFSINFIILLPIKLFCLAFGIEGKFLLYFTIRLVLFLIGLISVAAFYEIIKKLFSNRFFSLIASIFYILSPIGFSFFYIIHPEATGIMFIFFAILSLFKFIDHPQDRRAYLSGLIFLVLASLSKQIFFFVSLPILAFFFHTYSIHRGKKYFELITSKEFLKILLQTSAVAFAILLVVHRNAILEFKEFLIYQTEQGNTFTKGINTMSVADSVKQWIATYSGIILLKFLFITSPFALAISALLYKKTKNQKYLLYIFCIIGSAIILTLIALMNRLFILQSYTQPLYPFFIINLIAIIAFVQKMKFRNSKYFKYFANIFFTYFVVLTISVSAHEIIPKTINRFFYKDSMAYKSYEYVKNNLTQNDKLVYDHFVALPSNMASLGCHYWHGCGTDYIEKYNPNYIMFNEFNESFSINEKERLKKYVKDHKMRLESELTDGTIKISVYKK